VLGALLMLMSQVTMLPVAVALLVAAGAMGGLMVVPLNALLQHRGHVLLSAGRSVAVQGFNENASILVLVGLYTLVTAAEWPVQWVMVVLGSCVAVLIGALWWRDRATFRAKSAASHAR
jgi:protein-S-isoprenylcysteine O-methyltransferase Ste14